MFKRTFLIVLDACGVGELPDADLYGDEGSDTLGNTALLVGGLNLPNLARLGLGKIHDIKGVSADVNPIGCFGKMAELSPGKDSTTGHWELMGLVLEKPFPVYPDGFPPDIIQKFTALTGYGVLGNKPASGTDIIKELGEEHIRTGKLIVYTSADSVFQIAAHEEVVPVDKLYQVCQAARDMLRGEHGVGRVIARPFIGSEGSFIRTSNRHDFSLKPPSRTVLDYLYERDLPVIAIGKIKDLFAGEGISEHIKAANNDEVMEAIAKSMDTYDNGFIFSNLVDFDMLWGHRNNYEAFAEGLEEFDKFLPKVLGKLRDEDLLIITADHGCDPTTTSTDHSREYVPLIVYGKSIRQGCKLGVRKTFSDVGATISDIFSAERPTWGRSFFDDIKRT
ncbi:MAG: phosphopentomutase [candidate division Zixibacteria bacterium]|nr:phosphopentomutase [candidate division Zixibacteria bacterium]